MSRSDSRWWSALLVALWLTVSSGRAERELATDRPDATESPFTVEPGRVQLEATVVSYTRDRRVDDAEAGRLTIWNLAPVNVRLGLTPDSELQIMVDNYFDVETEERATGRRTRERGWGDVTLRYKRNLWGNDDGDSGLGLMPFIKLPTASSGLGNGHIEGGLIIPYGRELKGGWSFGAMTELDLMRNEADDGYEVVWLNTATVSREWTERWGTFYEVAAEVGAGKPVVTFNTGATYAVSPDIQLDAGIYFGLTRAAPDESVFIGFTTRF